MTKTGPQKFWQMIYTFLGKVGKIFQKWGTFLHTLKYSENRGKSEIREEMHRVRIVYLAICR